MIHVFETNCAPEESLARHIGFKEMKTTTFDTKEGKQMKLNRIPIYARNPHTRNIQEALLRIPQQQVTAAYGDQKSAKIRVAVDIVQSIDEIDKCFSDMAEATLPTLQKVAMALNRKIGGQDLDGLRVKMCGDSGACKIYVDVYRYGVSGRPATRFYRDTEDMSDVPVSQLFASAEHGSHHQDESAPPAKRRRADGSGGDDGTVISITPFKAELLLHVESVLICPSSIRFVLSVREGVVPSDVGVQYSLLRQGKIWGGGRSAADKPHADDPLDIAAQVEAYEVARPLTPPHTPNVAKDDDDIEVPTLDI